MKLQNGYDPTPITYHQPPLLYQDLEFADLSEIVRRVPTYQGLTEQDIRLESIALDRILPIQTVLTQHKIRRAEYAIRLHIQYNTKLFSPVPVSEAILTARMGIRHHAYKKLVLWLPPIVEVHHNAFVLIDGHHRLYSLGINQSIGVGMVQVIVVRGVTEPLPATPQKALAEWIKEVTINDALYARGKQYRYKDFEPSHWRDLKSMRPDNRRLLATAR